MAQKRMKRTDQEWFDLISDCKTSSLKVKNWCEQNGITAKALYYHTRRLRQKGYQIPPLSVKTTPGETQEVVCLDLTKRIPIGMTDPTPPAPWTAGAAVLRFDFQGTQVEISNDAARETIANTLLALQSLC